MGGDKILCGGPISSNWVTVASMNQFESNARETTLQLWSHLGSTLREVVYRNEQLEEENRRLRLHLQNLQQRAAQLQCEVDDTQVADFSSCPGRELKTLSVS